MRKEYLGLDLFPSGKDGNMTAGDSWMRDRAEQGWAWEAGGKNTEIQ